MPDDPYAFLRHLNLFTDSSHQPLRWQADGPAGSRGVLLLHGFPGTPANMRPLASAFHEAGWAVRAPLLPGFGPEIATLPHRCHAEWVNAAIDELTDMKRSYQRIVVVGNSLGAAVGMVAGSVNAPDAQVLLAPHGRFGSRRRSVLWPVLRLFARRWQPLEGVDFDDERIRAGIQRILPDIDLDDDGVRTELRGLVVPTRLLNELDELGRTAWRLAARLETPTLVVQGLRDGLVSVEEAAALVARMPNAREEFVDATNNITDPEDGAWEHVRRTVMEFAAGQAPGL